MNLDSNNDKRIVQIDAIRIYFTLSILFMHMNNIGEVNLYPISIVFNNQYETIMIGFFIISGFCLTYSNSQFETKDEIIRFYKKRLIRIMPLYFFIEIYKVIDNVIIEKNTNYLLYILPRIFGVQINFPYIFFTGVTWFISCILLCYFLFPLLRIITKEWSTKKRCLYCVFVILLYIYSTSMNYYLNEKIEIYYSVFFRILEFSIGVIMPISFCENRKKNLKILILSIIFWLFIRVLINDLYISKVFQIIPLILFINILCNKKTYNKFAKKTLKVTRTLSDITYELYMFQDIIYSKPVINLLCKFANPIKVLIYCLLITLLSITWKKIIKSIFCICKKT